MPPFRPSSWATACAFLWASALHRLQFLCHLQDRVLSHLQEPEEQVFLHLPPVLEVQVFLLFPLQEQEEQDSLHQDLSTPMELDSSTFALLIDLLLASGARKASSIVASPRTRSLMCLLLLLLHR
jgi:ABC-type transporter Mla MlaB component